MQGAGAAVVTLPPFLNAEALLASAGDSACALLRREPEVFVCLVMEARKFSARYYGAPIYLVGSAVTYDDPRDIDLVAIVPKALFYASYGAASAEEGVDLFRVATACLDVPKPWQRWARDCARQSADLTMTLRRAVDFKVQSDRDAVTISDAPRVLLAHVIP